MYVTGKPMRTLSSSPIARRLSARPSSRGAKQSIARAVIASEAKQSIAPHKERMDCFAALAMTSKHTFAAGEDVGLMGERLRPTGNISPSLRAQAKQSGKRRGKTGLLRRLRSSQ